LEPKRRDTEFLFYRSRWITALLQNRLADVPAAFDADFNQIVPADQLAARYDACEKLTPAALYAMWRAYLFDEPELARYLEIGRRHKARIVRDAAVMIDELRAGRKQLGAISDWSATLAAFRAFDLDPRRAEERKREAAERAAAEQRAKALANSDLDALEPSRWHELAWKWLHNGIAHRQLLARLDATSPTAAQLAEIDALRDLDRNARGLALARIADELSPELEAVLAGVLVRDDTLADALPVFADRDGEDEAPGWAAIDRALAPTYKATEPHAHFGTVLPYSLGGNDPIHGISAYPRHEPVPHWHFVTYGFTELFRKDNDDQATSGYGFELTFRLARSLAEDQPPMWALNFLQNLGRYVFGSGNSFAAGHKMGLNSPIALDRDTRITAICFADDPELGDIDSPHGAARFVQIVGITDDEYRLIQEWSTPGLLEILSRHLPFLITDLERASVLDEPAVAALVRDRVAREGSSEGLTFAGELQLATGAGQLRIEIGALYAVTLPRAMRGRIRHGRGYELRGHQAVLRLEPGETPVFRAEGSEVVLEVTPALAAEIEAALDDGIAGTYRFPSWDR
ncbi:MAG TPA: suppressor of fused domain protein, partial [Kofleriaceae bacterium]